MRGRAALVAVVVVSTAVLSAGCGGKPQPDPVAARFLTAVSRGDYAAAASDADASESVISSAYQGFLTSVSASKLVLSLSGIAGKDDKTGTAQATFAATFNPAQLGVVHFNGTLQMRRGPGNAWKVHWTPTAVHPALTAGRTIKLTRAFGDRSPILDTSGAILMGSSRVVTVGIHPSRLVDKAGVIATLARLLKVDAADLTRRVNAAKPDDFVAVSTLRQNEFDALRPQLDALKGVPYQSGTATVGPTPTFARAVLGRVGEATKDRLDELGSPYRVGDDVGLYGLEGAYERELAGTPTVRLQVVDADGRMVDTLATFEGKDGVSVTATIDPTIQNAAEKALGDPENATIHASLVAVDATNGHILAVVNRPVSSYNPAFVGRYPPGSTFKVVTTTALLGRGLHVTDPAPCPPHVLVHGKEFGNFAGESVGGTVPFTKDFAISCNTAFVRLANERLRAGDLVKAASAYGVGGSWQLPLSVFTGSVPDSTNPVELAAQSIGQGQVLVSPLSMAMVAAAVDSGTWQAPVLVTKPSPDAEPTPKPLPAGVAESIRGLMRAVVTSGTGRSAFAGMGGEPVYGKTGTAEFGGGNPPKTHAWFIGYRGNLAFAVVVEGGGVGGTVAAPIAAAFLKSLG